MFQEGTIVVRVYYFHNQTEDKQDIPIPAIVQRGLKTIFLFSRTGKKLSSKYNVDTIVTKEKPRAMINNFTLRNDDFYVEMFCLYQGRMIQEPMTYEHQM